MLPKRRTRLLLLLFVMTLVLAVAYSKSEKKERQAISESQVPSNLNSVFVGGLETFDIDQNFDRSNSYENANLGVQFTYPATWRVEEAIYPGSDGALIALWLSSQPSSSSSTEPDFLIAIQPGNNIRGRPRFARPLQRFQAQNQFFSTKDYDPDEIVGTLNNEHYKKYQFWKYEGTYVIDVFASKDRVSMETFLAFVDGLSFSSPNLPNPWNGTFRDPACGYTLKNLDGWSYNYNGLHPFNPICRGYHYLESHLGSVNVTYGEDPALIIEDSPIEETIISGYLSQIYMARIWGQREGTTYAVIIDRNQPKDLYIAVHGNTDTDAQQLLEVIKTIELESGWRRD